MKENYPGSEIRNLGFGLMRLPMCGEEVDMEQLKKMVDTFIEKGFTYFDTAYPYVGGKSERAVKEALVERYPRESYQLATKMPTWLLKEPGDPEKYFNEQLERTGAGYFDFYLMHSLSNGSYMTPKNIGAWEYALKLKEEGKIRHLGFSFHDSAEVLEKVIETYPEAEFVQLQINYADWEDDTVQSKLCYEVAMKHDLPVIIMEPVKGGTLAAMKPEIEDLFKAAAPEASVASWAVRYCASLPGLVTVLSGMSTIGQMEDNLSYMADFKPLDEAEQGVVAKVVEILKNTPTVPCTGCKYCTDDCPMKINIPGIFTVLNGYLTYGNLEGAKARYAQVTKDGGKASECLRCGSCESHCPQHIGIIEQLEKAADLFE